MGQAGAELGQDGIEVRAELGQDRVTLGLS
jgi:hypothetical protein